MNFYEMFSGPVPCSFMLPVAKLPIGPCMSHSVHIAVPVATWVPFTLTLMVYVPCTISIPDSPDDMKYAKSMDHDDLPGMYDLSV